MATPLTFGIEFEFLVATIRDPNQEPPDNKHPSKTIRFVVTDADWLTESGSASTTNDSPTSDELKENHARAVRRHITELLDTNGYGTGTKDYTSWEAKDDCSVVPTVGNPQGWDYVTVELVSPVLQFTGDGLQQVGNVLRLIRNNYQCLLNPTTSMHVHVGDGNKSFPFEVCKKVAAFFWAFERQFDTLFDGTRINNQWAVALRGTSMFAESWHAENGFRAPPIVGVETMLRATTMEELYQLVRPWNAARSTAYNMLGVFETDANLTRAFKIFAKPTIEFRQHHGCMSGIRAAKWISTVVGVVDYCRKTNMEDFRNLVGKCEEERWEKRGDDMDEWREDSYGKTLADEGFTIIDLLRQIGLNNEVDYWDDKWGPQAYEYTDAQCFTRNVALPDGQLDQYGNPFAVTAIKDLPPFFTTWEHEEDPTNFPVWSQEYKVANKQRGLWEEFKISDAIAKVRDPNHVDELDPNHAFWPAHKTLTFVATPPPSPEPTPAGSGASGGTSGGGSDGNNTGNSDVPDINLIQATDETNLDSKKRPRGDDDDEQGRPPKGQE